MLDAQLKVPHAAVALGQPVHGTLLQDFSFAYALMIYCALANSLPAKGQTASGKNLDRYCELHRQMMLALLRVPATTEGIPCSNIGLRSS
ncbi:hypothetical protein E6C76_08760 [Pseudothauera nasutitermitis]|uniref:Uncharacterized protein n=1 Tax=Pseudothauera nasutitermitis TaxID=2565930 RepID=A0A4S4B1S0_9RHOO|nr:hypothetical protein [Pseudothauera nasutitermitis]THF65647.1 hypothetical protein E6C76_08760 [Pseudothauera nasutitermitis]